MLCEVFFGQSVLYKIRRTPAEDILSWNFQLSSIILTEAMAVRKYDETHPEKVGSAPAFSFGSSWPDLLWSLTGAEEVP